MLDWMKHKLESRLQGEISIISQMIYTDITNLVAESEEELKNLLMKVKEESEKLACDSAGKESACNVGHLGSIPGAGKIP